MSLEIETSSVEETRDAGRRLGEVLAPGDVVALAGELGAGKTQFVKGMASGLGVDPAVVTSPTFVLCNGYEGRLPLQHYDLYRLESVDLESLGFFDHLRRGAAAVEWAEKAGPALGDRLEVAFESPSPERRRLAFSASGPRGAALLSRFRANLPAPGSVPPAKGRV